MELLEDKTNLVGAKAVELSRAHLRNIDVVDLQFAGARTAALLHEGAVGELAGLLGRRRRQPAGVAGPAGAQERIVTRLSAAKASAGLRPVIQRSS